MNRNQMTKHMPEENTQERRSQKASPPSECVLVVDDTAANHDVIRVFLQDINVSCESAYDGTEAIAMCGSHAKDYYSLILMDIHLPHMNGTEAARILRHMGIQSPIIAVTAAGKKAALFASETRAEDFVSGTNPSCSIFDHVLHKPFRGKEFYTALSPFLKSAGTPVRAKSTSTEDIAADTSVSTNAKTKSSADAPICDMEKAIDNMGSSLRLFTKHFNHFKQNNADLSLRMRTLLERGDYNECALLCHSIKGLAAMLGLTRLCTHIDAMEHLLHGFLQKKTDMPKPPKEINELLLCIGTDIRLVCQIQI